MTLSDRVHSPNPSVADLETARDFATVHNISLENAIALFHLRIEQAIFEQGVFDYYQREQHTTRLIAAIDRLTAQAALLAGQTD